MREYRFSLANPYSPKFYAVFVRRLLREYNATSFTPSPGVSVVNFDQVNAGWVVIYMMLFLLFFHFYLFFFSYNVIKLLASVLHFY